MSQTVEEAKKKVLRRFMTARGKRVHFVAGTEFQKIVHIIERFLHFRAGGHKVPCRGFDD